MAFHAGFDILQYPQTTMMNWLNANTDLVWCGYYLAPAPNRPSSQWMGQYPAIKDKWGVLPIYVGQQDARTGHDGYVPSSILTADQGKIDGMDACNLLAGEGFADHSFVFLDWEYGGLDGDGSSDYIREWISAVVADGRAQPGIYCSHTIAQSIADIIDRMNPTPNARFFCWKVPDADPHDFQGDITSLPELDPKGCGFAGAQVWQREQQAIVTFPADAPTSKLTMDFSTSSLVDPGAPSMARRTRKRPATLKKGKVAKARKERVGARKKLVTA